MHTLLADLIGHRPVASQTRNGIIMCTLKQRCRRGTKLWTGALLISAYSINTSAGLAAISSPVHIESPAEGRTGCAHKVLLPDLIQLPPDHSKLIFAGETKRECTKIVEWVVEEVCHDVYDAVKKGVKKVCEKISKPKEKEECKDVPK